MPPPILPTDKPKKSSFNPPCTSTPRTKEASTNKASNPSKRTTQPTQATRAKQPSSQGQQVHDDNDDYLRELDQMMKRSEGMLKSVTDVRKTKKTNEMNEMNEMDGAPPAKKTNTGVSRSPTPTIFGDDEEQEQPTSPRPNTPRLNNPYVGSSPSNDEILTPSPIAGGPSASQRDDLLDNLDATPRSSQPSRSFVARALFANKDNTGTMRDAMSDIYRGKMSFDAEGAEVHQEENAEQEEVEEQDNHVEDSDLLEKSGEETREIPPREPPPSSALNGDEGNEDELARMFQRTQQVQPSQVVSIGRSIDRFAQTFPAFDPDEGEVLLGEEEEEEEVNVNEENNAEQADNAEEAEVEDGELLDDEDNDESDPDIREALRRRDIAQQISQRATTRNGPAARTKAAMIRAELLSLQKKISSIRRSMTETKAVPIPLLAIEDEEDVLQEDVLKEMEEALASRTLDPSTVNLIVWTDGKRYYIEDGRHVFRAYTRYLKKHNERMVAAGKLQHIRHERDVDFNVRVVQAGQLVARVLKMVAETHVVPTVFGKTLQTRFIMEGLNMIHNPAMTMQLRKKLMNEFVKPKRQSDRGIPLYVIQVACLEEREFGFIRRNVSNIAVDGCAVLKLYVAARAVNPDKAYGELEKIDQVDDRETVLPVLERLKKMSHSTIDLLTYKGYSETQAEQIQYRILECKTTFSTFKRLTQDRNRLHRTKPVEKVFEALERCLPPVTFIRPALTSVQKIVLAPSTLFILDNESLDDSETVSGIAGLVNLRESRSLNFIVTNTDPDRACQAMNAALTARRSSFARRTTSSTSVLNQSMNQSMNQSSAPVAPAAPEFNVAAIPVAVAAAHYCSTIGNASTTYTTVPSCIFLRAEHGVFLNETDLSAYAAKMSITGNIEETCLRLLTFDPSQKVSSNDFNQVYVQGTSPEPFDYTCALPPEHVPRPLDDTPGIFLFLGYSQSDIDMLEREMPPDVYQRAGFLSNKRATDIASQLQIVLESLLPEGLACRLTVVDPFDSPGNALLRVEWYGKVERLNQTKISWQYGMAEKACSKYVRSLEDLFDLDDSHRFQLVLSTVKQMKVHDLLDNIPDSAPFCPFPSYLSIITLLLTLYYSLF